MNHIKEFESYSSEPKVNIEVYVPELLIEKAKENGIPEEEALSFFEDAMHTIIHERVIDDYLDDIIEEMLENAKGNES